MIYIYYRKKKEIYILKDSCFSSHSSSEPRRENQQRNGCRSCYATFYFSKAVLYLGLPCGPKKIVKISIFYRELIGKFSLFWDWITIINGIMWYRNVILGWFDIADLTLCCFLYLVLYHNTLDRRHGVGSVLHESKGLGSFPLSWAHCQRSWSQRNCWIRGQITECWVDYTARKPTSELCWTKAVFPKVLRWCQQKEPRAAFLIWRWR